MNSRLAAATILVAALAVTSIAAAGPVAAKQRIAIQLKGDSFVLTPLTTGATKLDTGVVSFCCWSERHIMRDGQSIDINNPKMTLTGKQGTLVTRNRIEWVDLPEGYVVFTGTWKVIRGSGAYAGLSGGGRGAHVTLPNGNGMSRFEGFLNPN